MPDVLRSAIPFWVTIDFPEDTLWSFRVERAFKMLCSWRDPMREERLYKRTWMRGMMVGSTSEGVEEIVREECRQAGAEDLVITVQPVGRGEEVHEDVEDPEGRPEGWARQQATVQAA